MRVRLDLPKDPEERFDQLYDLHDEMLTSAEYAEDAFQLPPTTYIDKRRRHELFGAPTVLSRSEKRKLAKLPTMDELIETGFIELPEPPVAPEQSADTEKNYALAGEVSRILLEGYDRLHEMHLDAVQAIAEATQQKIN
jgi:hypothetical protein